MKIITIYRLDENSNEIPENEIANVFLIKLKVESSNQK